MKKSTEQLIFPIIVSAISVLNIARNLQDFYLTSVLVSVIGIAAAILFLFDKKGAPALFYTWIILQLVTYVTMDFAIVTNQLPEIHLGLNFSGPSSIVSINFAPLFYFIGYRLLLAFDVIGKELLIGPIKEGSPLEKMSGKIVEYVTIGSDGKWYKVKLENDDIVFVKQKTSGERLSNKKAILVFVKKFDSELNKYQFIDWGKARLKIGKVKN